MGVLPLQFNQHTRSQARTIPYSKQYHNIHNTCIEYSTQNDTCSQQDNDVESTTYKDWFKHVNWYSKLICAHFWGTCILSKISHKIYTLKCAPLNSKCVWLRPDPLRGSALQTLAEMGRGMEGIRKMMDKGGRERGRRGTASPHTYMQSLNQSVNTSLFNNVAQLVPSSHRSTRIGQHLSPVMRRGAGVHFRS